MNSLSLRVLFNLLYDFVSQGKAESTTSLQLRLEIQVGNESRSAEEAFMRKTLIVSSSLCAQTLFQSVCIVKSLKCLHFSSKESLGLSSAVSTPEVERRYVCPRIFSVSHPVSAKCSCSQNMIKGLSRHKCFRFH